MKSTLMPSFVPLQGLEALPGVVWPSYLFAPTEFPRLPEGAIVPPEPWPLWTAFDEPFSLPTVSFPSFGAIR